jgi:hypothetical protein
MNYEKKYIEALDRANIAHKDEDKHLKSTLERIFPELKESEEERIRKELIDYIKRKFENSCSPTPSKNILGNWIAWLEKQNHAGKKWIYEDVYLKEKEQLFQDGIDEVLENPQKYGLEKQSEQKPYGQMEYCINCQFNMAGYCNGTCILKNNVKPKFKVGDWISNGQYTILVVGINFDWNGYYYVLEDGTHKRIEHIDKKYHLWSIEDAKDGDVLCLGGVIAIFKKYIGQEECICYCSFCDNGGLEIPIENGEDNVYGCTNTIPATKEQRDLLFQKMKESGYGWDANKKESINI